MRPLIWIALGAAALLATSSRSSPKSPAPGPNPKPVDPTCPMKGARVLLFGDSLAEGLALPMADLAEACQTSFEYVFKRGLHVTQIHLADLDQMLDQGRPTHMLVSLGGNDFQRTDPENVKRAIEEVSLKIRLSGALLLWIAPPLLPVEDAQVRQWWKANADSYFDTPSVAELEQYRAADKIHYSPDGYARLAELLWRWAATHYFVNVPAGGNQGQNL